MKKSYDKDEAYINKCEDILFEQEWLKALQEAEEDVRNNRIKPIQEVFIYLRNKLQFQ